MNPEDIVGRVAGWAGLCELGGAYLRSSSAVQRIHVHDDDRCRDANSYVPKR